MNKLFSQIPIFFFLYLNFTLLNVINYSSILFYSVIKFLIYRVLLPHLGRHTPWLSWVPFFSYKVLSQPIVPVFNDSPTLLLTFERYPKSFSFLKKSQLFLRSNLTYHIIHHPLLYLLPDVYWDNFSDKGILTTVVLSLFPSGPENEGEFLYF